MYLEVIPKVTDLQVSLLAPYVLDIFLSREGQDQLEFPGAGFESERLLFGLCEAKDHDLPVVFHGVHHAAMKAQIVWLIRWSNAGYSIIIIIMCGPTPLVSPPHSSVPMPMIFVVNHFC